MGDGKRVCLFVKGIRGEDIGGEVYGVFGEGDGR